MLKYPQIILAVLSIVVTVIPIWAKEGILVIHVKDAQNNPLPNIKLAINHNPSTTGGQSDINGRLEIPLPAGQQSGKRLKLNLIQPKKYIIISPWDGFITVPSYTEKSQNYQDVVLVQPGERALLEQNKLVFNITRQILNRVSSQLKSINGNPPKTTKEVTEEVAELYQLSPVELDHAIRELRRTTTDDFERAQLELYEEQYPAAEALLEKILAQDEQQYLQTLLLSAFSCYQQQKYQEASAIYREIFTLQNSLFGTNAVNFLDPQFEKLQTPETLAEILADLTNWLESQSNHSDAELLLSQALIIFEKKHHPKLVVYLKQEASLLSKLGHSAQAQQILEKIEARKTKHK